MLMSEKETIDQARYIMETGKLIHDRVASILAAHAGGNGKKKRTFLELSVTQLHVVKTALRHESVTITKLSEILSVSPPSASAMVDRLVEKGMLIRERSPEDRRKVLVRVSPQAVRDIEELEKKILKSFVELVEKIGPETAEKWCEVLGQIKKEVLNGQEVNR